jgi:hypothetical protein
VIRARQERARARGGVRRDARQRSRHGRRQLSTRDRAIRFRHQPPRGLALANDRPVRPLRRVTCLPVPRARNGRDARVVVTRASPSRRRVPCGGARFSLARADGVIAKPIPAAAPQPRAIENSRKKTVRWQCAKKTNAVIG